MASVNSYQRANPNGNTLRAVNDVMNAPPGQAFNPNANDPVYWQLVYYGGALMTEPPYNASIVEARKGAVQLNLVTRDGVVLSAFPLQEDGVTYLPIFCRLRVASLSLDPNAPVTPQLVATIYGRGRIVQLPDTYDERTKEAKFTLDGSIRMWFQGREHVDVPPNMIPHGGILYCLDR